MKKDKIENVIPEFPEGFRKSKIEEFITATGTMGIILFKAFGLKTHINGIIEDANFVGEQYELTFLKIQQPINPNEKSSVDHWLDWLYSRIPHLKEREAYKFWLKQALESQKKQDQIPKQYWAVFTGDGNILTPTITESYGDSIVQFLSDYSDQSECKIWGYWRKDNYACKPITISSGKI